MTAPSTHRRDPAPRDLTARLARRRGDAGFTLIELLVVIIILGILAAVVVFSVSGINDTGKDSAVAIDARTLRTAQEAYCAQEGRYADGSTLVADGYLSDEPEYHNVTAMNTGYGGPCNGWSYSILETAEANPDSGTFTALDAPPSTVSGGRVFDLIRYPDGRVVALIDLPSPEFFTADVWDPENGLWTPLPIDTIGAAIPDPTGFSKSNLYSDDKLIMDDPTAQGDQCGALCGRILLHAGSCEASLCDTRQPWYAFNPFGTDAASQFHNITTSPPLSNSRRSTFSRPKLRFSDNPTTSQNECGNNCGKFLITGGEPGIPEVERFAELFDPVTQTFEQIPYDDPTAPGSYTIGNRALLPDGRGLLVGWDSGTLDPIVKIFDPLTEVFLNGPIPSTTIIPDEGSPRVVLPSGEILFAGPNASLASGLDTTKAQVFRPATSTWQVTDGCATGTTTFLWCYVLGSLPDGRVLAFGQNDLQFGRSNPEADENVNELFIFDPVLGSWSPTASLPDKRAAVDSVLLDPRTGPCGSYCNGLLIAGNGASAIYIP